MLNVVVKWVPKGSCGVGVICGFLVIVYLGCLFVGCWANVCGSVASELGLAVTNCNSL